MDKVNSQPMEGVAPFGIQINNYFINGEEFDYSNVIFQTALFHAASFERESIALTAMVRQRMKKIDDLGAVLSVLNEAYAQLPVKKQKSDDEVGNDKLSGAHTTAGIYGYDIHAWDNKIYRRDCQHAQNDIQYGIDKEDNDLRQDMLSLESILQKRDNAFSTASKLMKKVLNSSKSIISNM